MKAAGSLRLGCTVEFVQRGDCLPLLEERFGASFRSVSGLDGSIRYQAISSGEVDVIDAFATDALLQKEGLVLLEDDARASSRPTTRSIWCASRRWTNSLSWSPS